jgi:heparan-alpha-glucosaminide N-acetyltransferase
MVEASAPLPADSPKPRLISLDAFRGAIMLLMASSALGIPAIAKNYPKRFS